MQIEDYSDCVQECWIQNLEPYVNPIGAEVCIYEQCQEFLDFSCPWSDYHDLRALLPQIEIATQRWNRFSAVDLARFPFLLSDPCKAMSVLSPLPTTCNPSTGFSDDAFAAILVARLHEENRLKWYRNIPQEIGDLLYRIGVKDSATLGPANLDPSQNNVVGELLDKSGGRFPPPPAPQLGHFDNSWFRDINGEDYIAYYDAKQNDRGAMYSFLRRYDVAIELVAANMYRGILAAKSLNPPTSGPTVFNMATWTLAGQIENFKSYNSVNPISNGIHLMNHVKMLLEGPCGMGLRAIPGIDFEYCNKHDLDSGNFDESEFQCARE
jgi:hypothetical protein